MIFRYKIEYEFEAEDMQSATETLNKGLVLDANLILRSLEAICSDDKVIPRKFKLPPKAPSIVEFPDATESREEPENDKLEHPGDDTRGTSPEPSNSRLATQSGKIEEEEDIPF